MQEEYLNIGDRASEIDNPKDRKIYRFLEILPGFLSLSVLGFAVLFSFIKPVWVGIFIICFVIYWVLKSFYISFYQIFCFKNLKKNLKENFFEKLLKIKNWQKIYHLIILPVYKEGFEVMDDTIKSISLTQYPKEKLIVILAVEEKGGEEVIKTADLIEEKYKNSFLKLKTIIHPKDLPGEIAGKGSNVAYAGEKAKEMIIDEEKIPYENIIVSNFDIDSKVYPQYFALLTYTYLTKKDAKNASFQPVPVYHNNIWEAPTITRIVSVSNTFWQMVQQERPEKLVTYSSHSMPYQIFLKVGYPKNVVSDDSRIFWKSFFYFNGNYKVIPLYYPISMDVVAATNWKEIFFNQYKQQRRWGWGCTEIPYVIFNFLKNNLIPFRKKIFHSLTLIEGFLTWSCASLIILVFGWFPIFVGGEGFKISLLSYNLPRLTGRILTFGMACILIQTIITFLFLPPRPKKIPKLKNILMALQWFLLPLTLIIFGAFPALDAQMRLLFGKYMGFWCTPKPR